MFFTKKPKQSIEDLINEVDAAYSGFRTAPLSRKQTWGERVAAALDAQSSHARIHELRVITLSNPQDGRAEKAYRNAVRRFLGKHPLRRQ